MKETHAASALRKGDYDLAASLVDPSLASYPELQKRIASARLNHTSRESKLRVAKRVGRSLIAALFLVVAGAAYWINDERNAAVQASEDAFAAQEQAEGLLAQETTLRNIAQKAVQAESAAKLQAINAQNDAERGRKQAQAQGMVASLNAMLAEEQAEFARQATDRERAAKVDQEQATKEALAARNLADERRRAALAQERVSSLNAILAEEQAESARIAAESEQRERKVAEAARDLAEERRKETQAQRIVASLNAQIAEEQAELAERSAQNERLAREREEREAYISKIGLAAAKIDENAFDYALQLLLDTKPSLRHWEWGHLFHLCNQSSKTLSFDTPVRRFSLSPDREQVAVAGWGNGLVEVRSISDGQMLRPLRQPGANVYSVAHSPSGEFLAVGTDHSEDNLLLWRLADGEVVSKLPGHQAAVTTIAFSKDGRRMLTGSLDKTVRLWDVATGQVLREFQGHWGWIWQVAFQPNSQNAGSSPETSFISVGHHGEIIRWTDRSGRFAESESIVQQSLSSPHRGPIYTAQFSPNGAFLATAGFDGRIVLSEMDDAKGLALGDQKTLIGHEQSVQAVRYSANGDMLLSASSDGTVRVWDMKLMETMMVFRGHAREVWDCGFGLDERAVLSSGTDGSVRVWNVNDYEEVRILRGSVLEGHTNGIMSAAFSRDGERALTASQDQTAKEWSLREDRELRTYREGHSLQPTSASFSPNGRTLYTAAFDNTIREWSVETGAELSHWVGGGRFAALALSPDGTRLLTGGLQNAAILWDLKTRQPIHQLDGHGNSVTAVGFSPDGRLVVTGDLNGQACLWDASSGELKHRLRAHTRRIVHVGFVPDGSRVLTASADNTIAQWDLETGAELTERVLSHPDVVLSLTVVPGRNQILTCCRDGKTRLWNLETSEVTMTIDEFQEARSVKVSPKGDYALAICGTNLALRGIDLKLGEGSNWETQSLPNLESFEDISQVHFAPDDHVLLLAANAATLYTSRLGKPVMGFGSHGVVSSAKYDPTGRYIVTAGWDSSIRIWDSQTGKAVRRFDSPHSSRINSVTFSPSGQEIITSSDDGTIAIHHIGGEVQAILNGHRGPVLSAEYTSKGDQLVSVSSDGTVRLWNPVTQDGEILILSESPPLCAQFASGEEMLVTGHQDNSIQIWKRNPATMKYASSLVMRGHTGQINSISVSRDGLRLLSGSSDRTCRVWDLESGKELLTLKRHTRPITSIAMSPDGKTLISSSLDGTAVVWPARDWKNPLPPTPPE